MSKVRQYNEQLDSINKSSIKALLVFTISVLLTILTPIAFTQYYNVEMGDNKEINTSIDKTDNKINRDVNNNKYEYEYNTK